MDTKWKKWKQILSVVTLLLGVPLFLGGLFAIVREIGTADGTAGPGEVDYQESRRFRGYVASRLEELLGVATGGKCWRNYGVTYDDGISWYEEDRGWYDEWGWQVELQKEAEYQRGLAFGQDTIVQETEAKSAWGGEAAVEGEAYGNSWSEEQENDFYSVKNRKQFMEEMARNKNLRYVVMDQNKLLYTNLEELTGEIGNAWDGQDFSGLLDAKEYNFYLWFNQNGDGKVQIFKDGQEEDVYGNGVYTEDSRWYVPGYTNFNIDEATKGVVVFLAVAKEPKLYVAGNYSGYGTVHYGGSLYYMQQELLLNRKQFQRSCAVLLCSLVLLGAAVGLRKQRKLANQNIAGFLGKIWLECKLLLLLLLPVLLFCMVSRSELQELLFYFRYEPYPDVRYLADVLGRAVTGGGFLTLFFWILYFLIVDFKGNRGRQKKPVLDLLGTRHFRYSIQKRLVKRYCLNLIAGIIELVFGILIFLFLLYIQECYYMEGMESIGIRAMILGAGLAVLLLLLNVAAEVSFLKRNRQLADDIGALSEQIALVKSGDLTTPLKLPKDGDLRQTAENLNEIQRGMEEALGEQMRSERMKVELVANVSHDIKTPLTSIISYVELLKQEEGLPDHVREFIQILGEKSQRLKTIVQDVFEVSKATSGQLPVKPEELDLGKLLRQTLAEMDSQILQSGLAIRTGIPEEPVFIQADGQRLYRVFQNLIQNALKYSLAGSRVFLTLTEERGTAKVSIKNISGPELDGGKDFTERFVRGDASRTDGGSGLGLSIAKSFTEACGGSFRVAMDADLFTVTVSFPLKKQADNLTFSGKSI